VAAAAWPRHAASPKPSGSPTTTSTLDEAVIESAKPSPKPRPHHGDDLEDPRAMRAAAPSPRHGTVDALAAYAASGQSAGSPRPAWINSGDSSQPNGVALDPGGSANDRTSFERGRQQPPPAAPAPPNTAGNAPAASPATPAAANTAAKASPAAATAYHPSALHDSNGAATYASPPGSPPKSSAKTSATPHPTTENL